MLRFLDDYLIADFPVFIGGSRRAISPETHIIVIT